MWSQQALGDTSTSPFDNGLTNQKTSAEFGQNRSECLGGNQLLINATSNQVATHGEVSVVQSHGRDVKIN